MVLSTTLGTSPLSIVVRVAEETEPATVILAMQCMRHACDSDDSGDNMIYKEDANKNNGNNDNNDDNDDHNE